MNKPYITQPTPRLQVSKCSGVAWYDDGFFNLNDKETEMSKREEKVREANDKIKKVVELLGEYCDIIENLPESTDNHCNFGVDVQGIGAQVELLIGAIEDHLDITY